MKRDGREPFRIHPGLLKILVVFLGLVLLIIFAVWMLVHW